MDYKKLRASIDKTLAQKIKMENPGKYDGIEDSDITLSYALDQLIPPMPDQFPKELEELANEGMSRVIQKLFGKDR